MVVTGGKRTVRGSCGKLEVIQFLLFEFLAKADIKYYSSVSYTMSPLKYMDNDIWIKSNSLSLGKRR